MLLIFARKIGFNIKQICSEYNLHEISIFLDIKIPSLINQFLVLNWPRMLKVKQGVYGLLDEMRPDRFVLFLRTGSLARVHVNSKYGSHDSYFGGWDSSFFQRN